MAAAVVSVTARRHGSIRIAVIDWVSSDTGTATATVNLDGQLLKFVTNPGAVAPTDSYDITLVDEDGLDVANGLLADRDTANSEVVYPFAEVTLGGTGTDAAALPLYHGGPVTFTLASAGDTKAGQLKVYMR